MQIGDYVKSLHFDEWGDVVAIEDGKVFVSLDPRKHPPLGGLRFAHPCQWIPAERHPEIKNAEIQASYYASITGG